jgi:hypothetical protein
MSPARVRSRMWDGTVLLGGGGQVPGWTDPFAGGGLGMVEPIGGTNIGAGKYDNRPFPTATISVGSGVSFNATTQRYTINSGVTVENVVIPGFLTLQDGALARNVYVKGPPTENSGAKAMVEGPSTSGQGRIEWSTIDPAVASAYYDGMGRGTFAYACDFKNIVDGMRAFSTSINGARMRAEACEFHDAVQFRPDYANSNRAETHNDVGIQFQGNPNGGNEDIVLYGCRVNARHSLTKGTTPPTRAQIAAIMVTPQASQGAAHGTVTWCWLYGGIFCINAGSDLNQSFGGSSLVVTNNRFERPGTNIFGDGRAPDIAFVADNSGSAFIVTHSGNTYIDNGAAVPKSNG